MADARPNARPPLVASQRRSFSARDASSVGSVTQNLGSPQAPAIPPRGSTSHENAPHQQRSPPATPDGHGRPPNPDLTAGRSVPKHAMPDWVDSIPVGSETAHYSLPDGAVAIAASGPTQSIDPALRISAPPSPTLTAPPTRPSRRLRNRGTLR